MENIPQEIIITEILTRFPAKSLLRFRCVSKQWFDLITDSSFIKLHLNYAIEGERVNLFLVSKHQNAGRPTPVYSLEVGYSLNKTVNMETNDSLFYDDRVLLGSCNGIVCLLYLDFSLCLLNPSTREYKKVVIPNRPSFGMSDVYGLGYDQTTDDYKLVQFVWPLSNPTEVHVYSLNNVTYTTIPIAPYRFWYKDQRGIYFGGAIYWIAGRYCDSVLVIICFDMKENTFHEMLPPPIAAVAVDNSTLGVLGGKLCYLCRSRYDGNINIWALKNYDISDSWYKLISIGTTSVLPLGCTSNVVPLGLAQSDKLVLKCGRKLVLYDPKGKTFTTDNNYGISPHKIVAIVPYVASLVPLKSGTFITTATPVKSSDRNQQEIEGFCANLPETF
ncbi:hypothetical protein AQUCO_05500034v1 [Aquilegia coerulea]|uniref:F-box domain-containing protein n=1 Tax=Aquilegia coerulea TaxID=218851 RepID=A0A2G5CGP2_AQUCA|nr:hypothetical protein AQUCO_05500034v1 [Aquilegia coerulea]